MHEVAKELIMRGLAYMDFSDRETMRANRGTLTTHGTRCEDADNFAEWHLDMFEHMAEGAFEEGECVLRAKIDMASPNMNLRDPVLYRIKKIPHNRTGDKWCIYPAYDFAHPLSDFEERVALSLCTLEFEDHRPFYYWVVARCAEISPNPAMKHVPVELEFARLELDKGLTSKRKINAMVDDGSVDGIDDPRLVTLAGLRRRGFTPSGLLKFCEEAGVSKANSTIPFDRVEDALRMDLDDTAPRRFVVADPIELDIVDGASDPYIVEASNHPKNAELGARSYEVSSKFWIDKSDARLAGMAEKGFKRVEPGCVFRIMPGVVLECVSVEAGADGLPCKVVAKTSTGKPRSTIHGLSRSFAKEVEIWEPETLADESSNPNDNLVVRKGYAEPLALATKGTWHAVRYGYCRIDPNNEDRIITAVKLRSSY